MKQGQTICSEEIKRILPYKYPMLLLDRVFSESENVLLGLKNLTINEEFFQGHFPNHPIMPGVLQVEAMQQVAEIAVKDKLDSKGQGEIYIKSLRKVKFRKPAVPGDRLMIKVEVKAIGTDFAEVYAENKSNSGVTCQANMILSVREKKNACTLPSFNKFDKSGEVAMDLSKIMAIIPHRYPFLLVDYILSMDGPHVVAVKNTTINEPIFHGFPEGYAVLPGAIQSEIIAQSGCVAKLSRPENKGKLAYFMSIDEAEYYHPVFPGDQLRIEVELPEGNSRFGRGEGFIAVDDKVISKTVMTFAVVDA